MKRIGFISMLVIFYSITINAQEILWTNQYNSGGSDEAYDIAVDQQGFIYVTGSKNGDYFLTIKYNSDGNTIWTQQWGNGTTAEAHGICIDNSGYVYVTGKSWNGTTSDYFTIKYDSDGATIWTQRFDGGTHETANAIAVDKTGNIYVTGTMNNTDNWLTIKYDRNWNTIWTQIYDGGLGQDRAKDIAVDTYGNCYVTGTKTDATIDIFTIKYDSAGHTVWTQQYDGGSVNDFGDGIFIDSNGDIYVTGASDNDYFTIKYDSNGNILWVKQDGGIFSDHAYDIAVDRKFNIYITGYKWNGSVYNYHIIKYDINRNTVWTQTYNSGDWDFPYGIIVDDVGYIYVTGFANGVANSDYFTIKYLQDPLELYSKITSLDMSVLEEKYFKRNGMIKGEAGGVIPAEHALDYVEIRIKNTVLNQYWNGSTWTASSNNWLKTEGKETWEYSCKGITWEYGEPHYVESRAVTVSGFKSDISEKVEFIPVYQLTKWSFCNYPNPFDPNKEKTCIEYLLLKNEEVRLLIYEISGRIVKEWKFKAGSDGAKEGLNRIYWDGKNDDEHVVANGVYFCYLKKKGSEKMTKIMVVK